MNLPGKFEERLQQDSAATAFQLVWGAIRDATRFVSEQEAVQKGMLRYASSFLERYGKVKVLGMSEPVPLRDIYTAAQVVPANLLNKFRTTDELQGLYTRQERRGLFFLENREVKRPGLELANRVQFLNLLGAPGAGKSTFLRRLGLEALLPKRNWSDAIRKAIGLKPGLASSDNSAYEHECLPVLIELRRSRTDEINLFRLIQNELSICGLPDSEHLVEALLGSGRLLVLLDGLDEVPSNKLDSVIVHVQDFVDRYSGNRFVTSCRTAFYKNYFPRFVDVLLADFDDEQIASFVRNWFRADEDVQNDTAGKLLRQLSTPAYAATKELAHTPLLLTFLCLAYDETLRLPANRSDLFYHALEILLYRWAASRRVHRDPVHSELNARLEVQMLTEIAAPAFIEHRYFFTRRELTSQIAEFLRNELNSPKEIDSDQVLEAIEVQQGLLVQRSSDAYSFSHLTLQEYLTAKWHVDTKRIGELIKHMSHARWREVFVLAAGIEHKADDLLVRMQHEAERILSPFGEISLILSWLNEIVISSPGEPKNAAKRCLALALAIDLSRAIKRANRLDLDVDIELYSQLSSDLTIERALDFLSTRVSALGSSFELDKLREGSKDFSSYSYNTIQWIKRFPSFVETLSLTQCFSAPWSEITDRVNEFVSTLTVSSPASAVDSILWQVHNLLADRLRVPALLSRLGKDSQAVVVTYINTTKLVVDCKNSATRVSRTAWDDVCRRILAVPSRV